MRRLAGRLIAAALIGLSGVGFSHAQPINEPFIVAINHEPDTLDSTTTINTVLSRPTMENVIEPIVGLSPQGDLAPSIADFEYLDDGRILQFTIREGVTFHSGDPLTVEDIVFSHERMAEHSSIYQQRLRSFDRVEIVDDRTVQFIFARPDVTYLPPRNLSIVSKAYFDRVGEDEFKANPVGTGPYKFVDYQPGTHLDLEAFEDYWGGAPDIERVRFVFVHEDTTRVAMLRAGEADMILNVPFNAVGQLEDAGFNTTSIEVTPTVSLQFVLNNPDLPWHDVRVRRAIAHAIDADSLVEGLFQSVPERHPRFGPLEVGYDAELENYAYDPALARELLAEAGYADGFDMPLIWWRGENTGLRETAEAVSIYLQQVGIRAQVSSLDVPEFIQKMRNAKASPTDENWVGITPTPLAQYFDPVIALAFTFWSTSPFAQYNNPEFDALVAEAVATVDEEARAPLVREATRILHEDVPQASLWNNVSVYAMKPGVEFAPPPRHLIRAFMKDVTLSE